MGQGWGQKWFPKEAAFTLRPPPARRNVPRSEGQGWKKGHGVRARGPCVQESDSTLRTESPWETLTGGEQRSYTTRLWVCSESACLPGPALRGLALLRALLGVPLPAPPVPPLPPT